MIKEFEGRPCPFGGTLCDLFKLTPKETISKVYLEHKMFETWYHKRSVLLGDGNITNSGKVLEIDALDGSR